MKLYYNEGPMKAFSESQNPYNLLCQHAHLYGLCNQLFDFIDRSGMMGDWYCEDDLDFFGLTISEDKIPKDLGEGKVKVVSLYGGNALLSFMLDDHSLRNIFTIARFSGNKYADDSTYSYAIIRLLGDKVEDGGIFISQLTEEGAQDMIDAIKIILGTTVWKLASADQGKPTTSEK